MVAKNKKKNKAHGKKKAKPIAVQTDAGFSEWVAKSGGSLVISTYQAGMMFTVGWLGNQLSMLQRHFEKPMGFDVRDGRLVLTTRNDVISFQNNASLAAHYIENQPGRYDALFLPRMTWHTADLGIHDIAIASDEVWLVNTRFSCLSVLDSEYSFIPRWSPSFITSLMPEDRCHLNGLTLVNDKPGFVTALGQTDTANGWRENKTTGGVVINVQTDEIVLDGLAMPHSPRWHDDTLWVLNSGAGQLLKVNADDGSTEVVCELQGYLRGLTFVDHYAIIGLCKIRESNVFGGMPVQEKYDSLKCGVAIVDTLSGNTVGFFEFTEACTEIYDIRFLPGVLRPNILNLQKEEARRAITAPPDNFFWMREQLESE